jgi:hypothetical protein
VKVRWWKHRRTRRMELLVPKGSVRVVDELIDCFSTIARFLVSFRNMARRRGHRERRHTGHGDGRDAMISLERR